MREKFNSLAEQLCISSITLGELHYGAEKSARRAENLTAVADFVARLDVLPYDAKATAHYGQLRAELELMGTPCGPHDMQIGGHARSQGLKRRWDGGAKIATINLAETNSLFYLVVNNKIAGNFVTVLYTPGQLRSAVSIAPETYRHWKKALGPLRRGRGHSPCFSSGDLVAMAVVRLLTLDMGIRVGALTAVGESLFDLFSRSPWPVLERTQLIIDLPNAELLLRGEFAETPTNKPVITIPLAPVIAQLREQLLAASNEVEQPSLRFPPVEITPAAASRGGRP